jgi:hypothetical protein
MAPRKKRKPTIDERLDAIAQSLELLVGMQIATEKTVDKLARFTNRFATFTLTNVVSQHKRIKKLEGR